MADKNAIAYANTLIHGVNSPINFGAHIQLVMDHYVTDASLSAGTTISFGKLPKGTRIIGGFLVNEAMGTGAQVKVGTTSDDDKYLAATSVAAANTAPVWVAYNEATNNMTKLTEEEEIIVTTHNASWASGKLIRLVLFVSWNN